jgi:hypothetical protein
MAIALLRTPLNPFDLKTVLLAKHAQHVVLIHFPIALFIAAVTFDLTAQWTKRRGLADTAYYNLLGAAISTLPVLATGILAWQFHSLRGAPGTCVRLERDDLGDLVDKFPRTAAGRSFTAQRFPSALLCSNGCEKCHISPEIVSFLSG